jgi:hypothetical protein
MSEKQDFFGTHVGGVKKRLKTTRASSEDEDIQSRTP